MDRVTIAEKVRFWQEQDRINKALIPRLIRTHELVTGLRSEIRRLRLFIIIGIGLSLVSSVSALIIALVK